MSSLCHFRLPSALWSALAVAVVAPLLAQGSVITSHPESSLAAPGGTVTLRVAATGSGALAYRWTRDGVPVAGATAGELILANLQPAAAGRYAAIVTDPAGETTSAPAQVRLTGLLWATGGNLYGQLGDGTTVVRRTPGLIDRDVAIVAAGPTHSLYVKADGLLWAMGRNEWGQLGNGTMESRSRPVPVATGVQDVAAGESHSLWLKIDGTLWAVGNNALGQLGDGTTISRSQPVPVATDVRAVRAGARHSLWLKTGGTLWGTGENTHGQLGDGTTTSRISPVRMAEGVCAFAAGEAHTMILKNDGTLWAVGNNSSGQLGDGSTTARSVPVLVASGVGSVAAGLNHSLFVKTDGTLWTVGSNTSGELGDGTVSSRSLPVQVATDVREASAGYAHSIFVKSDGGLWGTGLNTSSQYGDVVGIMAYRPVSIVANVLSVAACSGGNGSFFLQPAGVGTAPTVKVQPFAESIFWGNPPYRILVQGSGSQPLDYSWEKDGVELTNGRQQFYVLPLSEAEAAGSYRVVITNSAGSVVSEAVKIPVELPPPTITVQPESGLVVSGQTRSFTVTVTGPPPFTYQWYRGASSDVQNPIAGATGATFTTPGLSATTSYWVRINNSVGGVDSRTVTATVVDFIPSISLQADPFPQYWPTAGSLRIRVSVTYPGRQPATVAVKLDLPPSWTFASHDGPVATTQPTVGDNRLAWIMAGPADRLEFSFQANYPAGESGTKSVTGSVDCQLGSGELPFSPLVLKMLEPPKLGLWANKRLVLFGHDTTFAVNAVSPIPVTYQWYKDGVALADGGRVGGVTTATLALTNARLEDAGVYWVAVTNAIGTTTSSFFTVKVIRAGASHAFVGRGYVAGGTVTLSQTLSFDGPNDIIGWQMLLPAGWSYGSGSGEGDVRPNAGANSVLEWAWVATPPSPHTFTVTLRVPIGETGARTVAALAVFRRDSAVELLAKPDPLTIPPVVPHAADTDRDLRLSLTELTRVLELYQTRRGTVRTGCYRLESGTEDGFAADAARAGGTVVALAAYHSADSNRDGILSLTELTRLLELYNVRSGSVRTGQYHPASGTEDGFAPGP